jgi:uncharacterized glyoxalase superfamily protein PhnB
MSENTAPMVWPTLRARDARGLIRFLVEAFGFEEAAVYGEGDADGGQVGHAELLWPLGGGIMLGSARPAEDREPASGDSWSLRPGSSGIYVVAEDVDALFARAIAAGAAVLREPADTDYGSRECAVRDPEGNRWSFGTYRGARA